MKLLETQSELFDSMAAVVPELIKEAADYDSAAAFPVASFRRLQQAGTVDGAGAGGIRRIWYA